MRRRYGRAGRATSPFAAISRGWPEPARRLVLQLEQGVAHRERGVRGAAYQDVDVAIGRGRDEHR